MLGSRNEWKERAVRLELARFTDAARRPVMVAQHIAQGRGAEAADAADLLAGLLALDSEARDLLHVEGIHESVLALEQVGPAHQHRVAFDESLVAAVSQARVDASARRHPAITSCHVAAAVLRQVDVRPVRPVGRALAGVDLDADRAIEVLLAHAGQRLAELAQS